MLLLTSGKILNDYFTSYNVSVFTTDVSIVSTISGKCVRKQNYLMKSPGLQRHRTPSILSPPLKLVVQTALQILQ